MRRIEVSGNSRPRLVGWIAAIALWVGASGCTVIGFAAGSLADRTAARPQAPILDALREARGSRTVLRLADGREVRGRLARIDCADENTLVLVPWSRDETFAQPGPVDSVRVSLSDVSSFRTPSTTARSFFTVMGLLCDLTAVVVVRAHDRAFSPHVFGKR